MITLKRAKEYDDKIAKLVEENTNFKADGEVTKKRIEELVAENASLKAKIEELEKNVGASDSFKTLELDYALAQESIKKLEAEKLNFDKSVSEKVTEIIATSGLQTPVKVDESQAESVKEYSQLPHGIRAYSLMK